MEEMPDHDEMDEEDAEEEDHLPLNSDWDDDAQAEFQDALENNDVMTEENPKETAEDKSEE